jgi:hypothetical protein
MLRAVFGEVLLFFVPFVAFALYLVWRRRSVVRWASWSDQSLWLAIVGLVCVIIAFVITGLTAERQQGAFEPTHVEDGRVVPGRFR